MNTLNDVHNYFKLQLLLRRSHSILHQLFKNRYTELNNGTTWDDTPTCGANFKVTKKSLNKIQEISVSKGDSNQWDSSTLIVLLLQIARPNTLSSTKIQQLNNEDKLLKDLTDIRNKIAHHPSKSITTVDFHQFWTDLSQILLKFGDDKTEIDKVKNDSIFELHDQQINEENVKEVHRLNALGVQNHKEKNFTEAITFFMKATELSNVSNHDRAVLYSNLSSTRLALYEHQHETKSCDIFELINADDERYRSLQEAKQARNLHPTWWKGHLRIGKVYAVLNEHKKAITSFERALALSPMNHEIRTALDDTRSIYSRQSRKEHLDPRTLRPTISEQLKNIKEKLGIDLEQVTQFKNMLEQVNPAAVDVWNGHIYTSGDIDIKLDYEKAAYYYSKAAEQGNAEGIYNLACLTDRGLGVPKDHNRAHQLLLQAVNQSPVHPIFKQGKNVGVAEAEHALGLRYSQGIVVHKDPAEAAYWYERAIEHGSAEAANNLGLMYEIGEGVNKNLKKAEELFELSARRGDPNAMQSLALLLLRKQDLEMAKIWYNRACESGNMDAQIHRSQFEKEFKQFEEARKNESPNKPKLADFLENISKLFEMPNSVRKLSHGRYKYDYDILDKYAECGSKTAQIMRSAMQHFLKSMMIVMNIEVLTETDENQFVYELAQCYRLEHIVATFPAPEVRSKACDIVDRVLQRCNKPLNCFSSQLDEDVRICYAVLHMDSFKEVHLFLLQCIEKYPRTIYFFELIGAVYGWLKQYDQSVYFSNKGLEIDPNHSEILYYKAVGLRLLEKSINETIEAYKAFLTVAPKDHRKVPESYYAMASCYILRDGHKDLSDIAKKTYAQGEEAEKLQLPCFIPYKSNSKASMKLILDPASVLGHQISPATYRKQCLSKRHRIELITNHREWEANTLNMQQASKMCIVSFSHSGRYKQRTATSLVGLKPISIRELNPLKDQIYNEYVLSVTIIEQAYTWTPSIHLVVEDEHFDCERLCIYNFQEENSKYLTSELLTLGTKIHIINPYLRIGVNDMKPLIRIDDFSSIVIEDEYQRITNICRCCGQPNAPHVCSKCLIARYCSRQCQVMDWETYKHKLICRKDI